MVTKKQTKEDLRQAYGKPIADTLATNLKVIFCGINPGLYTAAMGYAYSHPGNRFGRRYMRRDSRRDFWRLRQPNTQLR